MRASAVCAFALWLGACSAPFEVTRPAGFVELRNQERFGYDYRATTAEGLVIAVRAIDNDERGDEAFWNKAVTDRVRGMGGYALLGSRPVTGKTGLRGTQHRFGHDEGRSPHLYLLTLFVTGDRLFLLEAGGEKALVERHTAALDSFVAGFQPR